MFPMNPAEAGARTNREQWIAMTRREWAWLSAASLAFAVVFAYPMLCETVYLGPGTEGWISRGPIFSHLARFPANGDWDLFTELRWVPYYTVSHFHQFPYWNPYKCGGMGMLGNPESAIVTPFFIPYLLFGPYAGLYIEIILHMAIGFAGGYALGRVLGLGRLAATVCGAVFPSSSWVYLHLSVGHLNFLPAAYLPWIATFFFVSVERKRLLPAAICGLLCALTLTEGNYTFLYAVILIASLAVATSVTRLSPWPMIFAVAIGLFALGFGALKLVPSSELLGIYPRPAFGPSSSTLQMIKVFLFSSNQDLYRESPGTFFFSEYGAYLSPALVVLAVVGVAASRLRAVAWILPAVVFFLLARGDSSPYSLLAYLRYFPLMGNIGQPGRFLIPFILCAGVFAAYGAERLCSLRSRWTRPLALILLIIGLTDAWFAG